jgi:hypothetical protein
MPDDWPCECAMDRKRWKIAISAEMSDQFRKMRTDNSGRNSILYEIEFEVLILKLDRIRIKK